MSMSTPISRNNNNKFDGPELYAPPRVRERVFFPDLAPAAETPPQRKTEQAPTEQLEAAQTETEQPETEQFETEQTETEQFETEQSESEPSEHELTAAAQEEEGGDEADDADALDWVDQAIRAVIEIEHASGGLAVSGPRGSGQRGVGPRDAGQRDAGQRSSGSRAAAPRSLSVAQANDESDAWERPSSRAQQGDRGGVRRAALRRPRLEPEIVPEPVATERNGLFPLVVRFSLVVVFAAIVAYGVTMLASWQPGMPSLKGVPDRVAAAAPQPPPPQSQTLPEAPVPSRLIVEDQQAFANQPLSLAVSIEHGRDNELLLLGGLAQGTTLSAGSSTSPSSWRLPYNKLKGLYLYAPKDFVGVMNTAVNLIGPDKRLLDSRTMQLKWVAGQHAPGSPPALATATASAEATTGDHLGAAKLATPGIEPIDPGEAEILMMKGRDFLNTGDISAARVAFRRLADAGIADAALALANTYNPDYLSMHGFLGVQGDRATARALYQRARELGSPEANRILAQMVGN
jgi:hypothetical protein